MVFQVVALSIILTLLTLLVIFLYKNVALLINDYQHRHDKFYDEFVKNKSIKNESRLTDPNDPNFKKGVDYSWGILQISLYKMFKEDKLLDFDSLFIEISNNIKDLSGNEQELLKWNDEYAEYLKNRINEIDKNEGMI